MNERRLFKGVAEMAWKDGTTHETGPRIIWAAKPRILGSFVHRVNVGLQSPIWWLFLYKWVVPIAGQGDGCAILSDSMAIPGSAYKSVQTVGGGTLYAEMQEGTFAPIKQN